MRAGSLAFVLIFSGLALSCGSDEKRDSPDGGSGSTGTGGSRGSSGGSGGPTGGSAGSPGGSSGTAGDGGGSTGGSGGSTGGSAGTGGSQGADDGGALDGGIDAGAVNCAASPQVFPVFDRACWDDLWCSTVFHQTDCCGNRKALGMLHPETERFAVVERVCQSQYPRCGCPSGPTTTDTGQTATDDSMIKVQCREGLCTTYVP